MAVFELLALATGTLILIYWLKLKSSKFVGIPEPPGNFLLGHALSLRGHIPKTFLGWRKSLGPVFQFRVFNTRALVLNNKESINKCCSKPEAAGRWKLGLLKRLTQLYGAGVVSSEGPYSEEQREFYLKSFRTVGFGRSKLETDILNEIDQVVQKWTETSGKPFELEGCATYYAANAVWNLLGSKRFSEEEVATMGDCISSTIDMDTLHQRLNVIFTETMEKISRTCREMIKSYQPGLVRPCRDLIESHFKDRIPHQPRDVIDMILDRMDSTESTFSPFHRNNLKHAFMLPEILAAS